MRVTVPQRETATLAAALAAAAITVAAAGAAEPPAWLVELEAAGSLAPEQRAALAEILAGAPFLGQGNPAVTHHPMTTDECRERRQAAGVLDDEAEAERICGAPHMAPLFDPARGETAADAAACIDRFEFPNLPCTYPIVWVRAQEAARICEAVGKRLCDAHEWEGACAGALEPPDYDFALAQGRSAGDAVAIMRKAHNARESARKSWSYGPRYEKGVCAAASTKNDGCDGGGWSVCGSNTYPTGAFPACRSPLGVYDLNGNAAEHMNLPLAPNQMSSAGSSVLGVTEMKGSWFIFDQYYAHEDWCRWRAPFWHGSRVLDPHSHHNYHLGFRCCKSLRGASE